MAENAKEHSMYNPTKWQRIKDTVRFWLCRHRNTEVRTVKVSNENNEPKLIGSFRYCTDCSSPVCEIDGAEL